MSSFSLDKCPEVELLGHIVVLHLIFSWTLCVFLTEPEHFSPCLFYLSPNEWLSFWPSLFLLYSPSFLVSVSFSEFQKYRVWVQFDWWTLGSHLLGRDQSITAQYVINVSISTYLCLAVSLFHSLSIKMEKQHLACKAKQTNCHHQRSRSREWR